MGDSAILDADGKAAVTKGKRIWKKGQALFCWLLC